MNAEDILEAALATKQLADVALLTDTPTKPEKDWHNQEMIKLYGKDWKKHEDQD